MNPTTAPARRVQHSTLQLNVLRKHGTFPLAYTTACIDAETYELGYKCLAYRRTGTLTVVVGEPMAHAAERRNFISAFLQTVPGTKCVFLQIGRDCAMELADLGLHVAELGTESWVSKERAPSNRYLKALSESASRAGVRVVRAGLDELMNLGGKEVSDHWLADHGGHEFDVLTRRLDSDVDASVCYLLAFVGSDLVGFMGLDPMYRDGEVLGYYHNLVRYKKLAPHGTIDLLTLEAINNVLRGEMTLSFGLSPFSALEHWGRVAHRIADDVRVQTSPRLQRIMCAIRPIASCFYPVNGNRRWKMKYAPVVRRCYLAATAEVGLIDLVAVFRLCGVVSHRNTYPFRAVRHRFAKLLEHHV